MALPDPSKIVGTPAQLVGWLGQLPKQKQYRLVEVGPVDPQEAPLLTDSSSSASIALLQSWIAQAPTDPAEAMLSKPRSLNR